MKYSPEGMTELQTLRNIVRPMAKSMVTTIRKRNKKEKRLEPWREQQLVNFLRSIIQIVSDIDNAHGKKRLSTVAWLTRNLLELSVWIQYCNLSDENAMTFRKDAARDMYGLWQALEQMAVLQAKHLRDFLARLATDVFEPAEARRHIVELKTVVEQTLASIQQSESIWAEQQFAALANAIGEGELSDSFTQVAAAARKIGRWELFQKQNKMLSKFAHPTALLLLSSSHQNDDGLDIILSDAIMIAIEGISSIVQLTAKVFPQTE